MSFLIFFSIICQQVLKNKDEMHSFSSVTMCFPALSSKGNQKVTEIAGVFFLLNSLEFTEGLINYYQDCISLGYIS